MMKYCAYCGKGFPILTFPKYAYKFEDKHYKMHWFCRYTCMLKFKKENPNMLRGDKRGRRKK